MKTASIWEICIFFVLCSMVTVAPAQTFTTLASFDGTDGLYPDDASLVQGADGSLYGTTAGGGDYNSGTVFKITLDGTLTTLYSFCAAGGYCPDGAGPVGLLLGTDGNFYGTTGGGGANHRGGTVFKATPSGTLTTMYSFCARRHCADGSNPNSRLAEGINGDFFGTTVYGGVNCVKQSGCGTIFRVTPTGHLTTVHSFNGTDGNSPYGSLILGTDGKFYGTTTYGGAKGFGEVFKLTRAGTLTVLYSFNATTDGYGPNAGLVQAGNGNFYGTTVYGGTHGFGVVFKITRTGKLTALHGFDSTDGANPYAGLIQATDGNLYGTTYQGGDNNWGTIFEMTSDGALHTVHNFDATDGRYIVGGLMQATGGNIYGTTYQGGIGDHGSVFSLANGLESFVTFVFAGGKTGVSSGILGQGFTGATGVMLNGVPASFTVVSDTYINATVPSGATTGYVTVTTPSGTLTSNVPFHVIP